MTSWTDREPGSCWSPRPRGRLLPAAGVLAAAALALSGCVSLGEEETAEDPSADGESTTEASQDASDEVPEWYEISSQLWAAMEAAESFEAEKTMPFSGEVHVEDEHQEEMEAEVGDPITQSFSGAAEGPAVFEEVLEGNHETTYHLQDDQVLMSGEDELELSSPHLQEVGIDPAQFEDDLAGRYVDFSAALTAGIDGRLFIDEVRAGLAGVSSSLDARSEERDGEEVWIYREGRTELVVRAGEEPVLLDYSVELHNGTMEGSFSRWNTAEIPEEIDDSDILTAAEVEELYLSGS